MSKQTADTESDNIDKARIRQGILNKFTNPKLTANVCGVCFNTALIHANKTLDGLVYTFAFVCPFCHSNDIWGYRQVTMWEAEKYEREGYARVRL